MNTHIPKLKLNYDFFYIYMYMKYLKPITLSYCYCILLIKEIFHYSYFIMKLKKTLITSSLDLLHTSSDYCRNSFTLLSVNRICFFEMLYTIYKLGNIQLTLLC